MHNQGQAEGGPGGPMAPNFRGPKNFSKFTLDIMALASESKKKKVMKEKNYQKRAPKSDLAPSLELPLPGPVHNIINRVNYL